jgi:hypothetical protein
MRALYFRVATTTPRHAIRVVIATPPARTLFAGGHNHLSLCLQGGYSHPFFEGL